MNRGWGVPLLAMVIAGPAAATEPRLVLGYGFQRLAGSQVVDSSPSKMNGRLLGSPALPQQATGPARHGLALNFDSTQRQHVNAGAAEVLNVDRFTLAAWVNYVPNVHDTRWEVIEKAGAYWINIRTDSRRVRVGGFFGGCSGNNVWRYMDSNRTIPANRWVHVASSYDGATLRLYVNGTLDRTLAVSGRTCANTMPLIIGAKFRPDTRELEALFDGRIDDLRVYDRALSAAQIRAVKGASLE